MTQMTIRDQECASVASAFCLVIEAKNGTHRSRVS